VVLAHDRVVAFVALLQGGQLRLGGFDRPVARRELALEPGAALDHLRRLVEHALEVDVTDLRRRLLGAGRQWQRGDDRQQRSRDYADCACASPHRPDLARNGPRRQAAARPNSNPTGLPPNNRARVRVTERKYGTTEEHGRSQGARMAGPPRLRSRFSCACSGALLRFSVSRLDLSNRRLSPPPRYVAAECRSST